MAARRRNRGTANPVAFFLISAVLIIMAIEMVITGYMEDKKTNALKERCTASTTAEVTEVTVETKTRTVRRNKRTVHETYYEYTTQMRYEVNGEQFALIDVRTSKDYEKGNIVNIQYDPDSPDVYYLQRYGDGKRMKTSLIPFGVIMLMAIIMIISGFRAKAKKKLNNGMSFEQWQEQQKQKEQETANARMDSVDMSGMSSGLAPNIRGSLNATGDYMESIGGTEETQDQY